MSMAATEAASRGSPEPTNEGRKGALELANVYKTEGNAAFAQSNFKAALEAYNQGLAILEDEAPEAMAMDLRVTCLNNRAMTLLRLEDYGAAEASCTMILEKLKVPQPKAYHRRAVAKEGMAACNDSLPLNQQYELLQSAKADLQTALTLLENGCDNLSPAEKKRQKVAVANQAKRLQVHLTRTEKDVKTAASDLEASKPPAVTPDRPVSSTAETGPVTPDGSVKSTEQATRTASAGNPAAKAKKEVVPSPPRVARRPRRSPAVVVDGSPAALPRSRPQQRQDIIRLLLMRQTQLQKTAMEGEAFYVVDWYWWSDFCHHVDLFYQQEGGKQKTMVLNALPPGTVVPGEEDDDDTDDYDGPPGPIDNSALFLVPPTGETEETHQQAYYRQWHRTSQEQELQLLPNLVRGYDFEILPREIYNALREWYGEVTPSICRRVVMDRTTLSVALYPQAHDPVPPLLAWNTKLYDRCGACRRPGVRLRCRRCMAVYYCNRSCQQSAWGYHKQYCQPLKEGETPNFVAQSEGRVGLITLGNTCFMNSALQCLSHTAPLTRHFLSGKYTTDLNRTNPLGTGGKLADAYAAVLQELWLRPGAKQVKPYALKRAIAIFAPRFAGTLQHDSQEFLAYLLDGLHEDLNRIRRAPYVEMPDFQDGQNMGVAGARAWQAHMRRNDSLVLDTLYGQFKSTCVCPQCNRVSVSFDAFNHVSLEIPQIQPIVPVFVLLVRAVGKAGPTVPERYAIPIRRSSPLGELKRELSRQSGIPFSNLHLCEVHQHEIVHIFGNDETAMGIQPTETLVACEAESVDKPCFHALVRNKTSDTDMCDFFGTPVLTSFPTTLTCKQVWHYFAHHNLDKVKDPKDLEHVLRVVFYDTKNNLRYVFPLDASGENEEEEPLSETKTAILPKDLDEPIIKFLGPKSFENFLHVWLEWDDVQFSQVDADKENESRLIQSRFMEIRDHPSYIQAREKFKTEGFKKKGVTLDECFQTFIKPERLDERNMWYCSNCKDHVRAMKTMELWRLPDVLVVHLKRFEFRNVLRRDKLETFVDFPVEGLDMSKHCGSSQQSGLVNEQTPAIYDLFGVVNHYGRMGFGHYTAFCREWNELGEMSNWGLFDDATVSSVVGNKVVSPAAYVLFYRRRPSS